MSQNFLVKSVLDNIWGNPIQDFQHLITPSRYSLPYGAIKNCPIYNFSTPLPVVDGVTFFHVYHIGRLPPYILQLDSLQKQWQNLQTVANREGTVVDVFLSNGAKVPLAHCWIKQLFDDNIVISVEIHPGFDFGITTRTDSNGTTTTIPRQLGNDVLSVRFYNNDMARVPGWTASQANPNPVTYYTQLITSPGDYAAFMAQAFSIETSYATSGKASYYVDGFLSAKPVSYNSAVYRNRYLTIYYDGVTIGSFSMPFNTMTPFQSVLDNTTKLLYTTDGSFNGIDYFDDIDFYITTGSGASKKGIFFPSTDPAKPVVRMVTHNSYALNNLALEELIGKNPDFSNQIALNVEAYVRLGAMKTAIGFNSSRTYDLYRMPFDAVKLALNGINSTIPEWTAQVLENSAYTRVMRSVDGNITVADADLALGYYAAGKVAYNPLQRVVDDGGTGVISIYPGYDIPNPDGGNNASIFGYDSNGLLLDGVSVTLTGTTPIPLPSGISTAVIAETINLPASATLDGTYHNQDVIDQALVTHGFAVYACGLVHGVPDEIWSDITGSSFYQFYPNGVGGDPTPRVSLNTVALANQNLFGSVRIANQCLFYRPTIQTAPYPGFMSFSVGSTVNWDGTPTNRAQSIPAGTLDIWMDGKPLIETIDYYVKWPTVVVVKVPDSNPSDTAFALRTYGLADANEPISHRKPREVGFVRGGYLTATHGYTPRNDRNLRVNVANKLYPASEVNFAEDDTYAMSVSNFVTDGVPYSVDDYKFQMEMLTGQNTQAAITANRDLDKRISDYIPVRKPQFYPSNGFLEAGKWAVFSPLISAIISCFQNTTWIVEPNLSTPYDNAQIAQWLAPLIWLLDFEPSVNNANLDFVDVRPHQYTAPVTLPADQYAFLVAVNHIYLKDSVDLSEHITIGG